MGEEDLTTELMEIFEERGLIEMAQRIKLRGQALIHRSTRNMRIQRMQEAFSCHLPPPLLPLHELHDYDLIKIHFNRMMKAEGMGTDWQPGQDPPAKVRQWWGEEDHNVFRMYVNQNLPKELMDIVRARHEHFRKNAIMFFKSKIVNCYNLRVGEQRVPMFHSRLSKEQIDEVNRERLEREAAARNVQQAAEEQERAAEIAAAVERQVQAQVEQALRQERKREQARNTREVSTERRRRRQEVFDEDVDEDVTGAEAIEHLQRRADPNASLLVREPAAIAVVRGDVAGPSRPTRNLLKCPYDGCPITRTNETALRQHVKNEHD